MSKHPRLMRRGGVYYFRCKIPVDLVDHYDKREIVESLRTKNATEALRKVRKRSEAQEQEFDRIRVDWCVRSISITAGTGLTGSGGDELFYVVPCNGPDYGEGALYDTLMYTDESCINEVKQERAVTAPVD